MFFTEDLVIGAHESQSVFVLRSIPVATVNISITTNVEEVELDSFNCTDFNEQPVTWYVVLHRFSYLPLPPSLPLCSSISPSLYLFVYIHPSLPSTSHLLSLKHPHSFDVVVTAQFVGRGLNSGFSKL